MRRSVLLATVLTTATFALAPLGVSAVVPARTVTVCPSGPPLCDFATIPAAIAAVSDGDTIRVAPGRYAGGFSIDKSISLVGSGQAVTTIVGGGVPLTRSGSVQVAVGHTVEMRGITITGDEARGLVNLGRLLLVDSTVSHNHEEPGYYGEPEVAGIYNRGSLTLRSSRVADNGFGRDGVGGILNDGSMTLDGSSVVGNDAEVGGIVNHGTAILRNSVVAHNGELGAGGILNYGKLVLSKCTVAWNVADLAGGIDNEGEATIVDSTILHNSVTVGDGGIQNRGTVRISRSVISANTGLVETGGLGNHGGSVEITDTVLSYNTGGHGGGIGTFGGTLNLAGSIVTFNTIDRGSRGGGIHNEGTQMTLRETEIFGNFPDDCFGCPSRWDGPSDVRRSLSPFALSPFRGLRLPASVVRTQQMAQIGLRG
jgi:hypothetical protein